MPNQKLEVKVNKFSGGINTEANPLDFPAGYSSDELNMSYEGNGSRSKRYGFDFNTSLITTNVFAPADGVIGKSQFTWENPGGFPSKKFIVVQIGNYLAIHEYTDTGVDETPIFTKEFDLSTYTSKFAFTSVDGLLIVSVGTKSIYIYEYDGELIRENVKNILVRDFWGLEVSGFTEPQNIQKRPRYAPSTTDGQSQFADALKDLFKELLGWITGSTYDETDATQEEIDTVNSRYIYNLRNQSFALPRLNGNTNEIKVYDCISIFKAPSASNGVLPSNADYTAPFIYPNANFSTDRVSDRYNGNGAARNPPGNAPAPKGYFIIDLLERGASRYERVMALHDENPILILPPAATDYPEDKTSGGPSCLAQYAGRVWFGGFEGTVTNGDRNSPRLSSYIAFSQLVKSAYEVTKCYQQADPTSYIDADIVDTDGGLIKIDGAYGINAMVPLGTSLFVLAANGVWRVVGADDNTFNATSYAISKVSDFGCVSEGSVVTDGNSIIFWGNEYIHAITRNQYGEWVVENVSQDTIQTFYEGIPLSDKVNCTSYYNLEDNSVRWCYGYDISEPVASKELVLNLKFNGFTYYEVDSTNGNGVHTISNSKPLKSASTSLVTVDGEVLTANAEDVYIDLGYSYRYPSNNLYCITTTDSATIQYGFGGYQEGTYYDWISTGASVGYDAFLLTGYLTGGDGRLLKNVPYLTAYFKKITGSSCLANLRLDWATNVASPKWTTPQQMYKESARDINSEVVVSKISARGNGRSLAIKFQGEEGKPLHIYGWEHNIEATTKE